MTTKTIMEEFDEIQQLAKELELNVRRLNHSLLHKIHNPEIAYPNERK